MLTLPSILPTVPIFLSDLIPFFFFFLSGFVRECLFISFAISRKIYNLQVGILDAEFEFPAVWHLEFRIWRFGT